MRKFGLLGTSALRSAVFVGFMLAAASPVLSQTATTQPGQPTDEGTATQPDDPEALGQNEVELESGQTADEGATNQAIVVTGTRIRSPNLVASIPITSIGVQDLLDSGDLSLGDALNDLPALRATFSQANSTRFIGTSGLNILDLRGLGTARTLVLVNGRRHVTSTPGSFAVDTNTIPQALLERVDVITGGSSALYGSDAVAGVVNFVLKRDFEGVQARAQGGISDRGDRGSYLASIVAGRNFLDDRLNVAVALEYTRQEQVLNRQREEQLGTFRGAPGFVTVDSDIQCNVDANGVPIPGSIPFCDPAVIRGSDGIPDTQFRNTGTRFGSLSGGSTVNTVCPAALAPNTPNFAVLNPINERRRALVCTGQTSPTGGRLSRNFVFLDDGALIVDPITEDLRSIGGGRFGGLTSTGLEGGQLIPESERYSANLLMNFELSRAFQPFLEAKYVKVTANQFSNQPTFVNSTLSPSFSINNAFLTPDARSTLQAITGNAATFTAFRFNFDLGTRSEINERETYRGVFGVRGDLNESGSFNYEIAGSYGRTDITRNSGGNVIIANFNRATNAVLAPASFAGNTVLNSQGQRVACSVNVDASTTNDDPACVPLNLFGRNNFTPEAADYVLYNSLFEANAEQINVVGFVSATTESFFNLPGGPIGAVIGGEYRRETAFSDSDDLTQSGATFLNAAALFDPPALELYEAFGELRIPLLADMPFFQELTLTGAGRVSDYNSSDKLVYAYNGSVVYAPIRDIKFRAGYARSVRAPDLSDLFQTPAQTFANGLVDPCNQTVINNNPNRAARCAEAGIPTTVLLPGETTPRPFTNTSASGISGFNQGNSNLVPEKGTSITVGAVIQPRFLPGFSFTVDYYDIKITQAISGLTGQAILNACFEDPVTIANPFCAAIFRRPSTGNVFSDFTFNGQSSRTFVGQQDFVLPVIGPGFLNQPFNFQSLRTKGVDFDLAYRREIGGAKVNLRAIVSYLLDRKFFTFISEPDRATNVVSVLGDPEWEGSFSAGVDFGNVSVGYDLRFIDRQLINNFENVFPFQGRQPTNTDAFPRNYYPRVFYHDLRLTLKTDDEKFRFYTGVDNVFDRLPPLGLTGTGGGSSIFNNVGRYFYAGAEVRF